MTNSEECELFYQPHLDRVSRSFAFCIARLESPLRENVSLGYLLCRILDTVEDAPWSDSSLQIKAYEEFDSFLVQRPDRARVELWVSQLSAAVSQGERLLLQDSFEVLRRFHDLDVETRICLFKPIQSMSNGMRHFSCRHRESGALKLQGLVDLNKYCFFVAGVVGEMLTSLVSREVAIRADERRGWLLNACRFGLFLQKVNILKDQRGDESEGRFFVPERSSVRASLLRDAHSAFEFLLAVPRARSDFRLFCAWSLFLGLASLPWIDISHDESKALKIPRDQAFAVLVEVESRISDDQALRELFTSLNGKAGGFAQGNLAQASTDPSFDDSPEIVDERSVMNLYRGDLTTSELRVLLSDGAFS